MSRLFYKGCRCQRRHGENNPAKAVRVSVTGGFGPAPRHSSPRRNAASHIWYVILFMQPSPNIMIIRQFLTQEQMTRISRGMTMRTTRAAIHHFYGPSLDLSHLAESKRRLTLILLMTSDVYVLHDWIGNSGVVLRSGLGSRVSLRGQRRTVYGQARKKLHANVENRLSELLRIAISLRRI